MKLNAGATAMQEVSDQRPGEDFLPAEKEVNLYRQTLGQFALTNRAANPFGELSINLAVSLCCPEPIFTIMLFTSKSE
jgi:hypothetical protein